MNKTIFSIVAASALGLISLQANAYTIDGQIDDWLAVGGNFNGNAADWTAAAGVEASVEEDQHDNFLNPGYGGQSYDAEAMYVDWDSNYFYYAIVTGVPQNGLQYPAGDIAFDFGADGSYELGIETLSVNNYDNQGNNANGKVDQNGVAYSFGVQGGLYGDGVDGNLAMNQGAAYTQSSPVQIIAGTLLDSTDLVYSSSAVTGLGQWTNDGHYVIEGRIDMSNFSSYMGQDFNVHWTMNCGNDEILLTGATLPSASVPVPGTVGLLGLAMLGMVGAVRRRRK